MVYHKKEKLEPREGARGHVIVLIFREKKKKIFC